MEFSCFPPGRCLSEQRQFKQHSKDSLSLDPAATVDGLAPVSAVANEDEIDRKIGDESHHQVDQQPSLPVAAIASSVVRHLAPSLPVRQLDVLGSWPDSMRGHAYPEITESEVPCTVEHFLLVTRLLVPKSM